MHLMSVSLLMLLPLISAMGDWSPSSDSWGGLEDLGDLGDLGFSMADADSPAAIVAAQEAAPTDTCNLPRVV